MYQKLNKKIELSENLDEGVDAIFSSIGKGDDIGLQDYRLNIQVETGGSFSPNDPDGGTYPQGTGPEYKQGVVAPQSFMLSFTETELADRIAKAGMDVTVENWVARMIGDAKRKLAHKRNQALQGYNTGLLATVDATYSTGTTVQLAATPFGARLIDRGDSISFTSSAYAFLAAAKVLDVQKNSIGAPDTITVDAVPSLTAGCLVLEPNLADNTPVFLQGLQYIVDPSDSGDYLGIDRSNAFVQAPAFNANSADLTLGGVYAFTTRMKQALGVGRFKAERKKNVWYGHGAQWFASQSLGFGKQLVMVEGGKAPTYDGVPDPFAGQTLGGIEFMEDTVAATDKLYFLDKSTLVRIRYPGSERFLAGPIDGIFFPRVTAGGLYSSQRDCFYQDSVQYATRLPWANGVIYNLAVPAIFSN
jgi:hypothetical protein